MSHPRPKEPLDFTVIGLSFALLAGVCHWETRRPTPLLLEPEGGARTRVDDRVHDRVDDRASSAAREHGRDAQPVDPAEQLSVVTVTPGRGRLVHRGDSVTVKIRTPTGGASTRTFVLGAAQVMPGVDEGVLGMQVGEMRRLLVPLSMAGKDAPAHGKPLHMDVSLVAIGDAAKVE